MTLREWMSARSQRPRYVVLGLLLLLILLVGVSLVAEERLFRHLLMEKTLLAQAQAVQATLSRLEADMAYAEASAERFGRMMSFQSGDLAQESGDLMALLERGGDGAWRSRRKDFDPATEPGIWIPPSVTLDDTTQRVLLRARRLAARFGPGLETRNIVDTWVLPLGNGEVIFYPGDPEFVFNATATTDYRASPWVQLTSPTQNPQGHPRWTNASYDPVARAWMVSVVVPYFHDGKWAGSVGHDRSLHELEADLTVSGGDRGDPLAPRFVVRRNGELLLGDGMVGGHGELLPEPYRGLLSKVGASGIVLASAGDERFIVAALPGLDACALYPFDEAPPSSASEQLAASLHLLLSALIGLVAAPLVGFLVADASHRRVLGAQLEDRNRVLQAMVQERTSELEEANASLEALMLQDHLTGLGNRRAFDNGLERAWGRARRRREPLALVLLDVDQFKLYNDQFGHQQGDACLRIVGRVIRESTRRPDDLPFRYGGEEFGLLLPDTDTAGALRVAEQLRVMVLAQQVTHPGSPHGLVTVSLGVAACAADQEITPEALVARADAALYRAKQNGRNRVEAAEI